MSLSHAVSHPLSHAAHVMDCLPVGRWPDDHTTAVMRHQHSLTAVLNRGKDVVRVPVMVFIPGDSFSSFNSGSAYDGSVLSAYGNIVVVTINYRLGVLGE